MQNRGLRGLHGRVTGLA